MSRHSATQILEATLRLIAKGGVDAVRYRDVASESGVPLGTISYQFSSREELIRSAFKHHLTENETVLRNSAAAASVREPRDVAKLMANVLEAEWVDPERMHLAEYELLVYASRDPEMAEMLVQWDRKLISEFAKILEGVGVTAPLSTAETLLEMARGFSLVRLGQQKRDYTEFRKRIERVLVGLTAAPEVNAKTPRASAKRTARR
ncbi:MAG: TetR family transcriptional regulator [Polyangiaceae bacterium]